jgi:benzoyl-CoA reductase subunit C
MEKIAYFDSTHDMPEEIIMAAGYVPYKIMGDMHTPLDTVESCLAAFFCPAARSFMVEALSSAKDWAGIVFAHGCDATNRHFDIWKMHVKTPYLYWLNVPLNTDRSAAKFFKKEIERFIGSLENQYNVNITINGLEKAIQDSNAIKRKLQKLGSLRSVKDIPNTDYFDLVGKCLQLPKDEVAALLDRTLEDWEKRPAFPEDKIPILLTGSDITYREFMEILEIAGFRAVRDDLSIGERYYATLIPKDESPIDALIAYHFSIPAPPTKNPPARRIGYLMRCMEGTRCKAVVSQNLKFCEPFALDAVLVGKALKEKGYPLIHIERDFTPNIDNTLVTRLQAFRELL